LGLGGGEVAEEAADVVFDAEGDFAPEEPFSEFGHSQIDEDIFGAGLAGHLPGGVAVAGDDQAERARESAAGCLYFREAVELAGLGGAAEVEQGLPELVEELLMEVVTIDVPSLARGRSGKSQLRADIAPIDAATAPAGFEEFGVVGVLEDDAHTKAQGARLRVERVFDQGFEFAGGEELLKGVRFCEEAVAVRARVGVGFLACGEGGDDESAFGQIEGGAKRGDSLGGVLDDIEDVAEVHDGGGGLGRVWPKGRVPAGGLVAEGMQRLDVHAMAASVIEKGVRFPQESAFQQLLDGLGKIVAFDGGAVTRDFGHPGFVLDGGIRVVS